MAARVSCADEPTGPWRTSWRRRGTCAPPSTSTAAGAAWFRGGVAWFTNWADQRLYRFQPGGEPVALTPEPAVPRGLRYADGDVSPDGATIACVRERHEADGTVANEIVLLPAAGGEVTVTVTGPDFVSNPRWRPDGDGLCWIEWDHPNMPWDGTRLIARVDGDEVLVAGGPQESVLQPVWEPGGTLLFLSDRSGWWNLYRWWPSDEIEHVVDARGRDRRAAVGVRPPPLRPGRRRLDRLRLLA